VNDLKNRGVIKENLSLSEAFSSEPLCLRASVVSKHLILFKHGQWLFGTQRHRDTGAQRYLLARNHQYLSLQCFWYNKLIQTHDLKEKVGAQRDGNPELNHGKESGRVQ